LSATALERYKRCPLQFKIERDWKLPGDAPASMQFGQVMHGALKEFYDARLGGRALSLAELLDDFRRRMQGAAFDEELQRSLYLQEGEDQLRRFMEDATAIAADVLSTERTFTAEIGGVQVKGRIDRIDRLPDGGAAVTDYKTGKPKDQDDADKSIQLSIYAIAAERSLQQPAARLVLHNLEDGSRVETSRTHAALIEAEEEVRAIAARIADEEFPAIPGRHCDRCPYFSICPEKEQRLVTIEQKKLVSRN
jgi:ATP-dependent DNA helicase UvrD/PcrA